MSKCVATVFGLGFLLSAVTASAQPVGSGVEITAGYQVLHVPDETFPLGFVIDAAGRPAGFTIAGEFGWARDDQNEPGVDGSVTLLDYGIGPRWSGSAAAVRPFVQLLLGGVHTSASLTENGSSFSDSDNAFMLQPGAGVVVPVGARWGVVAQGDYRRVFFEEEGDNEFRFLIGVRLPVR